VLSFDDEGWNFTYHSPLRNYLLLALRVSGRLVFMKYVPKETTDDALIQEFLNNGGKISVGKTKPMRPELGISKNVWNNVLTKEEKTARDKK
jgi:hypothetical protein